MRLNATSSLAEDKAAPPGPRIYTRKDSWRVSPPRSSDNSWNGFVGNWYCDFHDPQALRVVQTLRTWRPRDASRSVWDQTNVHSEARPGSAVRDSPADGLHQKVFEYQMDRTTFDTPMDTSARGLVLALDGAALVSMGAFTLPAIALEAAPAAPPPAPPPAGPAGGPPPVWGFEMFLHDGACRWSLVLLYSTLTGELSKVTFVQEYDTRADPATPHVLAAAAADGTLRPARPQLDAAAAADWVSGGARTGRVLSRVWAVAGGGGAAAGGGGGGAVRQLMVDESLEEPIAWGASSSLSGPPLLVLPLPDAMYLRAPASLKGLRQAQQQQQAQQQAQGGERAVAAAFEFGGLLRSMEGGLQRVVVRYDAAAADGGFVDATREVFVRGNKFEKQAAAASRTSSS
ncbi:hypothetical protein HYH02_002214 [Chlamydomonas schloesseri]|uniref:DUF3598 domain-containing protein n=1 Tax=Chlamydomonas schloesseri TaxID=2026947 RepID=A0A836BBC9_9CHLO|nr:hypothetical protein HYH02_002214 [Chlamydomonas schloesseri]|eukprot:KAG2452870.1 hypothetical protein HYH02_002214 [Chlamydomonas schloesseri]